MLGNFLKKFFGKIRAKTDSEAGFTLVSLGIGMVLTLAVLAPTVQWFLSLGTTLYHNQSAMNMETLALGEYNAISNESYMDAYSKQGETETTTSSDGKYRIKIIYGEEELIDGTDDMPLSSIPIEIRVEDISDSSKNFVLNHKIVSNTENSGIVHQVSNLLDKAGKLVVPCHQNETRNSAGTCVCNSGYEKFNKRCVAKCGTDEVRNASGTCVCVDGYEKVGGVCKPKCGTNQVRNSSGACTCASGYEPVNNICKPKCGANQTRNSSGDCTCASGYEVFDGKCVTVCPSGQTRGSDGSCKESCPEGETMHPDGICSTDYYYVDAGAIPIDNEGEYDVLNGYQDTSVLYSHKCGKMSNYYYKGAKIMEFVYYESVDEYDDFYISLNKYVGENIYVFTDDKTCARFEYGGIEDGLHYYNNPYLSDPKGRLGAYNFARRIVHWRRNAVGEKFRLSSVRPNFPYIIGG